MAAAREISDLGLRCFLRLHAFLAAMLALSCGARSGLPTDELASDGGKSEAAASCEAGDYVPLIRAPSRFLFLADASASMWANISATESRWDAATQAMRNLLADPRSAGLSVGLTIFPVPATSVVACSASSYSDPLVALGALSALPAPADTQEALLVDAFSSWDPNGGTPLVPALQGAFSYLTSQPAGAELGRLELVLITDGVPSGCEAQQNDVETAVQVAQAAHLGPTNVITHVIGLRGELPFDEIAKVAAAGGGKAVFVDANSELATLLYDALVQTTRSCAFRISGGGRAELALVNPDGSVTSLVEVSGADACASEPFGWYRDSAAGDLAVLCPAACDRAENEGVQVVRLCPDQ